MSTSAAPDWSATQYLKFNTERTRAVHDLVSQVAPHLHSSSSSSTPLKLFDLGCGPGNSAAVLASAFPGSKITGMDSSPDMLSRASAAGIANASFVKGDLATYEPDKDADLVFSNAAFHWLRSTTRLPTLVRLLSGLKPGAVLALQVPDNYHADTHRLMRETALIPNAPWSKYFANVGDLEDPTRPDLDPIESPTAIYNALKPHAASINIWRTEYVHVLADPRAIVEWVRSTGFKPFLDQITDDAIKEQFLNKYEENIAEAFERTGDGKVLLPYPRLFVVAVRA
jgi:trans-aconitate 2-methyltransferase